MMDLHLLTPEQVSQLGALVSSSSKIVILGHSRPDGDAIGSTLAWSEYLSVHYGKRSQIIVPNAYPDFLHWLPGTQCVMRYDKRPDEVERLMKEADLVFCLDFNAVERLEGMAHTLETAKAKRVLIDHHLNPTVEADMKVSFPDLSSTSEIVFRLVWQMGDFERMTKKFAVPLYCGMMTDTGGFTYNSSSPEIFYAVCQLLTKRFDKDKIYRNVYNNYSSWAIRLRGHLMSQKLNVFDDLHACYYTLTRQEMRDYHYVSGDGEGLVNEPLRIKGMKMSISLREDDRIDNKVWVSLRSVDDFSVEEVAKRFFNGGGHLNASGGQLDCSLDEAVKITREAIKYYAEELKK